MATDGKLRRSAHWSKLGLKLTYIIPQERGLKRLLKLICKRWPWSLFKEIVI